MRPGGAGLRGQRGGRPVISHLFRSLTPNRFLEDSITNSILSEEEIADSASSELASIRRHMRSTEARVRDILQRLISSNQSKYLQESIITIRSDRYVVPVKAEHKNAIPGLVHDVSSSGSTFFIEPMGVVKANNELRELAAREKRRLNASWRSCPPSAPPTRRTFPRTTTCSSGWTPSLPGASCP